MDFKEAYKFPLKWDNTHVFTADDNLAFQFANRIITQKPRIPPTGIQMSVVRAINGEDYLLDGDGLELIYNDKTGWIESDGKDYILIRGWGHLTGQGGLRLSEEQAEKIQDDFAKFIIKQLA